ncbi:hypothetical protein [Cytobacillus sp. IB215316]|uniref:hypothetical protein n=1 Tax=Cytobacillus sp. IB215316 TaxID=3097354 RepID=UPI002A12AB8A|nr:hypothetical protein [Cytobacillus sp. IB215316]MDX8360253.1 hypothetical protein [Cytobacillus sp. IB215316]
MHKSISFAIILFIIVFTISLYVGISCLVIYLLSLISSLAIEIYNWHSMMLISLLNFFWLLPFDIISSLFNVSTPNKKINDFVKLVGLLVNVAVFSLFVIWLNNTFTGVSFSKIGLVCYILAMTIIVHLTMIGGTIIEEQDKRV